jgi:hypothetical protein
MKKSISKRFNAKTLLAILSIVLLLTCQQLAAQQKPLKGTGKANAGAVKRPEKPSTSVNAAGRNSNSSVSKKNYNNSNAAGKMNSTNNSGNRKSNINSGNKNVNIDNSKKNVNVNINNSQNRNIYNNRNTAVRRNNYRPYPRPPYVYGGHRYRCYHPYRFHPYRPFMWGPMWHPWGFFVVTLAATAIILTVDNNMPGDFDMASNTVLTNYPIEGQLSLSGPSFVFNADNVVLDIADQYYYDQGVYYLKGDGGYTVVAAPLGASIKTLPSGYETVSIDDNTKNYYYGGTFYEKSAKGEDVKMGDITYVKLGDTYYQPIQQDGKDMYEVADVEDDK